MPTITLITDLSGFLPFSFSLKDFCVDDTPADGQWACPWDPRNFDVPLTEGITFPVQVEVADAFGQITQTGVLLTLDATPPTVTLDSGAQAALADGILGPGEALLTGAATDNHLLAGVEVCGADGACNPASLTLDAGAVPQTTFVYDDAPAAPIPITANSSSAQQTPTGINMPEVCGAGTVGIWRTFNVTDTFTVAEARVGLNISHPYRSDLLVKLWGPSRTVVNLVDFSSPVNAPNLDVLLTDAARDVTAEHLRDAQDVGLPYYDNLRRPAQPLSAFNGQSALGAWTLVVCDQDLSADVGAYNRAQLILKTDVMPQNTRGTWSYAYPYTQAVEGKLQTLSVYALDSVGNRTDAPQVISFTVDNVAPRLVVTQTQTQLALSADAPPVAITGIVSDGVGARSIMVMSFSPSGQMQIEVVAYPAGDDTLGLPNVPTTWAYRYRPLEVGAHTLSVVASDRAGNTAVLGNYTVNVIEPPVLTKEVTPQIDVPLGSIVTYTLRLSNANPDPIAGIVITDPLPALLSHATFVTGTAFSMDNDVLSWGPLTITGQSELDFVFTAVVTDNAAYHGATVSNTAYLAADRTARADLFLAPPGPSLMLTKTVAAARVPVWPGDPITYTLIAANAGGADAEAVWLTDTLPAGLIGAGLDWTGVLTAGQTLSFTLPAQVISETSILGHSIINTAWLSHTSAQLSAAVVVTIRGAYIIYLPVVRKTP